MMNVKLQRSYRSANGNPTFVYSVKGNESDLAKYKEIQGTFFRTDDVTGDPLWFTTRCIGQSGKLIITTNNKIVPDMSEFDQAASMAAQYGGNFGQELAKATAQRLAGGGSFGGQQTSAPDEPAATIDNVDNDVE